MEGEQMTWVGIVLGAVGLLFLTIGVVSALRTRKFLNTSVAVQGELVGFEEQVLTDSDGDRTSSTHAVVQFVSAAGATVTFTEGSQTFGGLQVGDPVPVRYDPSQPERARIATGGRLWVRNIVVLALGAGLLIAGVIVTLV
jgi:hypothetical protein